MESVGNEITHEFRFFRVHRDGRIEKFIPTHKIPPFNDLTTGVQSKDVVISNKPPVSARMFLPRITDTTRKLPVLFYIHGVAFCFRVRLLSDWARLQWIASHANGNGQEPWLNEHADLNRVFVGGDSGGGNVTHTLVVRVGSIGLPGLKDDEMWLYMFPTSGGLEDPRLKPPAKDLSVAGSYYEELKKSRWGGSVEVVEHQGEDHVFHLMKPDSENAVDLVNKFASFIVQG
ncbi:hypothetical protein I3760_05G053300 [Carya illinoinensis]|uniref:Alpha/beta hydrolase fold-3 domain-containing protein n=1 Tax=Carya illinoinensis TaxID=32201 RepID=A0A922F0X2_CARIL|nr:hypothetical protein I3760_05G053300 [Carya illinoinensis]KAG6711435.1 hypothetical protein I3842_05G052800 [Carya illinoinensis]